MCSCPAPPGAFIPERLGREDAQSLSTCWDARWFGFVAENPASQPCCEIFRDLVVERVMFSAPFFCLEQPLPLSAGLIPGWLLRKTSPVRKLNIQKAAREPHVVPRKG